ncbi:podocalyxin isoform X1 [Synchiropus splendidus]|uniref:podocalyxin isoform X1 n=2 Tax=Synchiropus splendidus TaxID=270530 RepID=UPI00237E5992|nr:podocalyxin isoform X1 [Synchiropus splendidus]
MRATIRITWLLLSLSVLCHHVWSDDADPTGATVTKDHPTAKSDSVPTAVTTGAKVMDEPTTATTLVAAAATTARKTEPTTVMPIAANSSAGSDVKVDATSKPPIKADAVTPAKIDASVKTPAASATKPVTVVTSVTDAPRVTPAAPPSRASTINVAVTPSQTTVAPPPPASVKAATSIYAPMAGTTKPTTVSTDPLKLGPTTEPITPPAAKKGATATALVASTTGSGTLHKTTLRTQVSQVTPTPAVSTASTNKPVTRTETRPAGPQTSSPPQSTADTQTPPLSTAAAKPVTFKYELHSGQEETEKEKELVKVCRRLMENFEKGTCTLRLSRHQDKVVFDSVSVNGNVKTSVASEHYEDVTRKPNDNRTLIAILASCGALLIMIVILAVCASHHRKPYSETQQHLTEELHVVENGYHDNPTLEVMEVQPEMQEKKLALNGEFNDNWIVPIDNLLKEDLPDEEDTHL